MTVRANRMGVIALSGRCGAEEAEVLQQHLLAVPESTVEWTDCEHLHTAVLQVLLAGGARMRGTPKNTFLATHVAPILKSSAK
jgi:hypothetical protein